MASRIGLQIILTNITDMKRNFTVLGAAMLLALPSVSATHMTPAQWRESHQSPSEAFRWAPRSKAEQQKWQSLGDRTGARLGAPVSTADHVLGTSESVTYLDMPDGTTWFVTTDYEKTVVEQYETYTRYDITGIKSVIYNDKYEQVGRIESAIEKPEGFELCSNVAFGPCVSRKFFNTDDNYEVMVMANFKPEGEYGAIPFTYVFSLRGPETPAEQVLTMDGYYTVAVNNAADDWSEDFFMEFFSGEEDTEDSIIYNFDIYTKASYSSPTATLLKRIPVDMVYVMSDGENEGMPVMINSKGRTLYATVARYEKTFFEEPLNFMSSKLSEDNKYLIDLYKKGPYDSELTLQTTTSIDCAEPESGFTMRSYGLGMFEGYNDITFDFGDDPETPAYIVSVVNSDIQENKLPLFEVYAADGTLLKTFGEGHMGFLHLSSVSGEDEQYCFLMSTGEGETDIEFSLFDYPSMEKEASIPVLLNEGPQPILLSLALDRVPNGDSYRYAVSGQYGYDDAEGNTYHNVVWFDEDGAYLRTDHINGGKNISLINPYISADGLTPYLFNTDEAHEYMFFAQRRDSAEGSTAHTELCVVNDRGEMLVQYPFEREHSGINVALVNHETNPAIWIIYEDMDHTAHSEFISLPLNSFEGTGTVDDPYLIRTRGDMDRIKFNLNANFRLANDISYEGAEFKSVSGVFSGSLDGAGHMLRGIRLEGKPMFDALGNLSTVPRAFVRDLTIRDIEADNAPAVLADNAYAADIEKVNVVRAEIWGETESSFGTLVNNAAMGTVISECAVKADIDMPGADEVGGLVSTLGNDSKIKASSFDGTIKAASNVGGIAGYGMATASITDCHATASIDAGHTIGGIIGNSARTAITRCFVEGDIKATAPRGNYSYHPDSPSQVINVGGIAGSLATAPVEYDNDGNPLPPDPNLPPVISDCVVGISSIEIPESEELRVTAHRVVGYSAVNHDPEIVDEIYNEDTGEWEFVWGDPAAPEDKLADNYVIDSLAPIHAGTPEGAASTEGQGVAYDDIDQAFFENLGFGFLGYNAEQPWVIRGNRLPAIYHEAAAGQFMQFEAPMVSVIEGNTVSVRLLLDDIEFDSLTIESSDEANCIVTPTSLDDDGNALIDIEVVKEGNYTVTASNGMLSAVLQVSGTSGINGVTVTSAMSFDGSVIRAEGCAIIVYSLQGAVVAEGRDAVDMTGLPAGVYAATAVNADGTRHSLKINKR